MQPFFVSYKAPLRKNLLKLEEVLKQHDWVKVEEVLI